MTEKSPKIEEREQQVCPESETYKIFVLFVSKDAVSNRIEGFKAARVGDAINENEALHRIKRD